MDVKYWFALDEAYKSLKDGKHITPYSGEEIRLAVSCNRITAAKMMRTFNKIFCSDRITIERAFGQLVRRFPALWLAIQRDNVYEIQLIVQVLAKLHNLCVDEFLCKRFGYTEDVLHMSGEEPVLSAYPQPTMPKTYEEFLSKMPGSGWKRHADNNNDQDYNSEMVPGTSEEELLTRGNDMRRSELSREYAPRAFTTDNATINAGMAMASDLDVQGHLPVEDPLLNTRDMERLRNDLIQADRQDEQANVNCLQHFIDSQDIDVQRHINGNLSAARRLKMTLDMYEQGLRFGDSVSLREERKS